MSKATATLTSIGQGICYHPDHEDPIPMTGTIITSSIDVKSGSQFCARVGDIVQGNCGHTGVIIDGCNTVIVDGVVRAQVGSNFTGDFVGVIISGESDVMIGE